MASITLDRRFNNVSFESWKIGRDFVGGRHSLNLPASVYFGASDSLDFQHTRASALHNHLIESLGRFFVVVGDCDLRVFEITCKAEDDAPSAAVSLVEVAGVRRDA